MTSQPSSSSLAAGFDGIVCDLDGVVYLGPQPVPHAVEAMNLARRTGTQVAFATNNASRTPHQVAHQLRSLGLEVADEQVVTSSQAGAARLVEELGPGTPVLVVGGPGVLEAVVAAGLVPRRARETPRAGESVGGVLQGLGQEVNWLDLAEAAVAVRSGALWVATNLDATVPTDRGECPGNGAMVGAVRHAVAVDPVVTGKPEAPLYLLCASILGCRPDRTLAVGDRLDTDVVGAAKAGMSSLHVGTGVNGIVDVARAEGDRRPTFLASDLRALHVPYLPARVATDDSGAVRATCAAACAVIDASGGILAEGGDRPDHRLRALVAAAWAAHDAGLPDPSTGDWERVARWYLEAKEGA